MIRLGAIGAGVAAALFAAGMANDARACGGCFHEPPPPNQTGTVVTDHRMIFSISTQQTTLYDEIKYSGSPSSFAWVLPIRGAVTVGLSSDFVFASLEQATQTTVVAPPLPPCPQSSCSCGAKNAGFFGAGGGDGAAIDPGVNVISQETVGPYDTVQLQSTDPNALDAWLATNGYAVPADVQPVIAAYVAEGFDFLALKLAPGQGIAAMRPVRVTSPGAGLSLPLRMVAAGTGATVGITLWVVADGGYEPQNFPFFTISPSELTWDWSVNGSDYGAVRANKEASFHNGAWQIESSLALSPYQIENPVLQASASANYTPVPASDAGGATTAKTADEVRADDLAALFPAAGSTARITRMRADLSRASLANDLVLQASAGQTLMSNIYQLTQAVNVPKCPSPPPCPCGLVPGGCDASASEPGNGAMGWMAAAFVGMALAGTRRARSWVLGKGSRS